MDDSVMEMERDMDTQERSGSGDDKTDNEKREALLDKQRNNRLLYLFQCDLLPGITGKILESKEKRDNAKKDGVSLSLKIFGYITFLLSVMGMVFYVMLFALQQNESRQSAWLLSFILWLLVEIFFVSSFMVIFTHIIVPFCIIGDLHKIKHKLMKNINSYRKSLLASSRTISSSASAAKQKEQGAVGTSNLSKQPIAEFNAARYLFVSLHVAARYSDL